MVATLWRVDLCGGKARPNNLRRGIIRDDVAACVPRVPDRIHRDAVGDDRVLGERRAVGINLVQQMPIRRIHGNNGVRFLFGDESLETAVLYVVEAQDRMGRDIP